MSRLIVLKVAAPVGRVDWGDVAPRYIFPGFGIVADKENIVMEPTGPHSAGTRAEEVAALTPTTISHCPTLNEAQMLVSLLSSFGIEAKIEGENYLRMLGSMVPGIDGIRVQVRQADAEAALEILNPGPESDFDDK